MGRLASVGAIVLVALGCGCTGTVDDSVADLPSQACVGEPTRPLRASELTRALRRHGFTVFPVPGDAICEAPVAEQKPVSLGNVISEGPHDNYDQRDEITEREGHVFCGLRRGPIWGWKLDENLDAPPASPIFSGDKAEFYFANLECTLYPEGERRDRQVRDLQRAVGDLVRLARNKRG
jgi:hypothetical protein